MMLVDKSLKTSMLQDMVYFKKQLVRLRRLLQEVNDILTLKKIMLVWNKNIHLFCNLISSHIKLISFSINFKIICFSNSNHLLLLIPNFNEFWIYLIFNKLILIFISFMFNPKKICILVILCYAIILIKKPDTPDFV